MELYLPVANMSVGIGGLLALGLGIGMLSGLFGVGGGFISVPLLIFMGVPPAVAVASQSNQLIGTSLAGYIAYARRGEVDDKMAVALSAGGAIGSVIGALILYALRRYGQSETVVSLLFIFLIGCIGLLMLFESVGAIVNAGVTRPSIIEGWRVPMRPFMTYFPESHLAVSYLAPMAAGVITGITVSLLGVGGAFFLVPIMLYVFGMSSRLVTGTCFLAMLLTSAVSTLSNGLISRTVDPVLALILLIGSLFGTQLGIRLSRRLPGNVSRMLMALLLLIVAGSLLLRLMIRPDELFTLMRA